MYYKYFYKYDYHVTTELQIEEYLDSHSKKEIYITGMK